MDQCPNDTPVRAISQQSAVIRQETTYCTMSRSRVWLHSATEPMLATIKMLISYGHANAHSIIALGHVVNTVRE